MSDLYVFEGADNVGKTSIASAVESEFLGRGRACRRLSFPGDETTLLGAIVREIHESAGDSAALAPAALQLMHVAAHVDLIERSIRSLLSQGTIVLLDRFWWSTAIYAKRAGVPKQQVDAMLEVEFHSWGSITPTLIFLIDRVGGEVEQEISRAYRTLAKSVSGAPVRWIANNGEFREAVAEVVELIDRTARPWPRVGA